MILLNDIISMGPNQLLPASLGQGGMYIYMYIRAQGTITHQRKACEDKGEQRLSAN